MHEIALVDKGSVSLAVFQPGPDHLELHPSAKTVEVQNFTLDDSITVDGARYKSLRYSVSTASGAPVGELAIGDSAGHTVQVLKFDGNFKFTDFVVTNTDQGVQIALAHPATTTTVKPTTTVVPTTPTTHVTTPTSDAGHVTTTPPTTHVTTTTPTTHVTTTDANHATVGLVGQTGDAGHTTITGHI